MRNLLIICAIAIGFTACEKQSGEGGTSVIEGQVYKIFTFQNPTTGAWDTSYFQLDAGRDVFIIYSNDAHKSAFIAAYLKVLGYDAKNLKYGAAGFMNSKMLKLGFGFSASEIKNYPYETSEYIEVEGAVQVGGC